MTKIINLYGGPGTGKSTSAAYLYYALKQKGINAELVREYVKEWAWEGRKIDIYDQIFFLGKQLRKETLLYNKVDYIVTDSPIMLSAYYAEKHCPDLIFQGIRGCVKAIYEQAEKDGLKHIHVMLKRSKGYNAAGRYQSENEALQIDTEIKKLLDETNLHYLESGTSTNDLNTLLESI